jgi:hypothetical protein
MMHERKKSDLAVVAMKLANKAERSATEPVEPRAGTKGNADQHSTYRAQYRASVSPVLERIRQVRRQTPEVGDVCGKAARTVLCGAMRHVPRDRAKEVGIKHAPNKSLLWCHADRHVDVSEHTTKGSV